MKNQSNSAWVSYRYTASDVDWLAVYDATTDRCYYIHSSVFDGMSQLILRLAPPANNQRRFIRWARDYLHPTLPDRQRPGPDGYHSVFGRSSSGVEQTPRKR